MGGFRVFIAVLSVSVVVGLAEGGKNMEEKEVYKPDNFGGGGGVGGGGGLGGPGGILGGVPGLGGGAGGETLVAQMVLAVVCRGVREEAWPQLLGNLSLEAKWSYLRQYRGVPA
eukprot:Gb_27908 [translate_table: standard]